MPECGHLFTCNCSKCFIQIVCGIEYLHKNKNNQLLVFVVMGGIPEITRDASVGNVALVIVSATIVLLMLIVTAALFIKRKDWHLDGKTSLHLRDD